jgi:hypothetical protein
MIIDLMMLKMNMSSFLQRNFSNKIVKKFVNTKFDALWSYIMFKCE